MVALSAVVLTAIIHLLMRISVFYEQPKNQCSPAPEMGSWFFVLSVFMILSDNDIYPYRYRCIPVICQNLVETFISIVATEFSTIVLWCNLEKAAFRFTKCILSEGSSNLYNDMGGDMLVGFLLTLLGLFILCNTAIATGYYDRVRCSYVEVLKGAASKFSNFWKKCPTISECEMAVQNFNRFTEGDDCLPITPRRRGSRRGRR